MRRGTALALLSLLALGGEARAAQQMLPPPAPTNPGAWRASYAVVRRKIEAGLPVRIGIMGGSISRGAATFPRSGVDPATGLAYDYSESGPTPYYDEVHSLRAICARRLQQRFGTFDGQIQLVNLCLAATSTYEATFRYGAHALPHDLDMLIVEFAVNDLFSAEASWADPLSDYSLPRMLESLVMQARRDNPDMAFALAISTARDFPQQLGVDPWIGRADLARKLHRSYAISRRIPFVDLGEVFYGPQAPVASEPLYNGPYNSANRVHMSPHGHRVYGEALADLIGDRLAGEPFAFPAPDLTLPAQLQPYPLLPIFVRPEQLPSTAGFAVQPNGEPSVALPIYQGTMAYYATQPGAEFEIPFQGRTVSLWWQSYFGYDTPNGNVIVWVDGQYLGMWQVGGQYFPAAEPMPKVMHLGLNLDPQVPHVMRVACLENDPGQLRLALHGVLIDSQ